MSMHLDIFCGRTLAEDVVEMQYVESIINLRRKCTRRNFKTIFRTKKTKIREPNLNGSSQ